LPRTKSRTASASSPPAKPRAKSPRPASPPSGDFAKNQIARLEPILDSLAAQAMAGELGAVDRIVKILDRLDRYYGYAPSKEAAANEEDSRAIILRKLSDVDARRAAARELVVSGELEDVHIEA
jgi:hypothetical protein